MSYINAEEILPIELVESIQQYVEGQMIYVPKQSQEKTAWGTKTGTRNILRKRNQEIYSKYLEGVKVAELAENYYLTEKSIQRIIRNLKT